MTKATILNMTITKANLIHGFKTAASPDLINTLHCKRSAKSTNNHHNFKVYQKRFKAFRWKFYAIGLQIVVTKYLLMVTFVTLFKCNLLSAGTEPLNRFQNMYMQALIMFDTGLFSGKLARDNIEPLPGGMC